MKKLFALMLAAVAIILTGCSSKDDNMLCAMPGDVVALARIDLQATASDMGYSWTDFLELALKDEGEDTGIDFTGKAYAFVTKNMQSGIIIPLSDAEKFSKKLGGEVEKRGDIYVADRYVAFDSKRLVYYENRGNEEACKLLEQSEVDDSNKEIIRQVADIKEPVAGVLDGAALPAIGREKSEISAALAMMPINCSDLYLKGGMAFDTKSAKARAWLESKNADGEKGLDKLKEQLSVIKDAKIPFVANDYSYIFAVSLNGKAIWDAIPGILFYQMSSIARSEDIENVATFVQSLYGLTTITVGPVAYGEKSPWLIATAEANNLRCLDGLMGTMAYMGANVLDEGNHCYTINLGGEEVFVGAQGGFAFLNYGTGKSRPEGNNTIKLEKGTCAYVNVQFKNIDMEQMSSIGLNEYTMWSKNDLSLHCTLELDKTWKELVENLNNKY